MVLNISKQLAPVRPGVNCFGYGNKADSVTIHQTGNTSKGANAKMHAKLQSGVYGASWQWQVDDVEAIQSFENNVSCYHASDGRGPGNLNSIAIEGCINVDGDYVKAVHNMAELAAKVLKEIGKDTNSMFQHNHFDTKYRKNCPAQIRAGKDGINWALFVQMVKDNMNDKTVSKPVKPNPQPNKSISTLVEETKKGLHSNGDARKKSLGSNYNAVMNVINGVGSNPAPKPKYNLPTGVYRVSNPMRHGNDVLQIQLALSSIYFYPNKGGKNNGCDSWYGNDTANAVKRFQSVHGLVADGVYGDNTRKKLHSLVN